MQYNQSVPKSTELIAVQLDGGNARVRFFWLTENNQIMIRCYDMPRGDLLDLGDYLEKRCRYTRYAYGNVTNINYLSPASIDSTITLVQRIADLLVFYDFRDMDNAEAVLLTCAPNPKRKTRQIKSQIPS